MRFVYFWECLCVLPGPKSISLDASLCESLSVLHAPSHPSHLPHLLHPHAHHSSPPHTWYFHLTLPVRPNVQRFSTVSDGSLDGAASSTVHSALRHLFRYYIRFIFMSVCVVGSGVLRQLQVFTAKLSAVYGDKGCNGFRHLENGQTFFRYGGLLVIFRCHPGYKLHGYRTNSCVSGHWSRDTPVCVGEELDSWAQATNLFILG